MIINGIQTLSLSDYDGKISTVLFAPACNFKCHFCHNSSLVVGFETNPVISETYILDFLKSKIGKINAVVISGGEPTLQPSLKNFIIEIKKLGFLVKLDTNGTNPALLKDLIDCRLLDYVAMDIKSDWEHFNQITNTNNDSLKKAVKESIDILLEGRVDYEFRTTIVNEIHTPDCMKNIAQIIKGAKRYVLQKYIESKYVINKIYTTIPVETANQYKAALSQMLPLVGLRNY